MICRFCLNKMEFVSSYGDGWNDPVEETYKCDCGSEVTTMGPTVVWEEPKKYELDSKMETILKYAKKNKKGNLLFSFEGGECWIVADHSGEEWYGWSVNEAVDKVLNDFIEAEILKECEEDEI